MVDGSRRQGPTSTTHITPASGQSPNTMTYVECRYLNSMCKHFPFQMDGVGKVAQCSCKGAQQVTSDHKFGFHNVPLAPKSWEFFELCWRGVYYVQTVLCFGWCASPYIYHSLSDAVAQCVRSQDIPIPWLDDVLDVNRLGHTRPRPDRPTEGSP